MQAANLPLFLHEAPPSTGAPDDAPNRLPGPFFFHVTFDAGDLVMPKGVTNDYALLLIRGTIQFIDREAEDAGESHRGCWEKPSLRWLDTEVERENDRLDRESKPRPVAGWTGSLIGKPLALAARLAPALFVGWIRSPYWRSWLARRLRGRLGTVRRPERELADADKKGRPFAGGTTTDTAAGDDANQVTAIPGTPQFIGVTRVILNQPWPRSLRAGPSGCEVLLIRRVALIDLIAPVKTPLRKEKALMGGGPQAHERLSEFCSTEFFRERSREYLAENLTRLLTANRLFRDLLSDGQIDWKNTLAALRKPPEAGIGPKAAAALRRHRKFTRRETDWLATLTDEPAPADKDRLRVLLNGVVGDPDWGHTAGVDRAATLGELNSLLGGNPTRQSGYDKVRLNRLVLRAALGGAVAEPPPKVEPKEFETLAKRLRGRPLNIVDLAANEEVYGKADDARHLYLILSGMVEVRRAGTDVVLNNLDNDGYFGATCAPLPPRSARATTRTTLLRIDKEFLPSLVQEFPWLGAKVEIEQARDAARDAARERGDRRPHPLIPLEMSRALMPARNVLLIDMDLCTRCDQCVRGCAEAHEGQPRFHRANPKLRFGKWEVAGACLHCVNAPCQLACPVGAIALLPGGEVQIHRTRCIGCNQCEKECPYGVIDMLPPLSPSDGSPVAIKKQNVANKCDLCLTDEYDPPCVACCPYDAAHRVDLSEALLGFKGRANPA